MWEIKKLNLDCQATKEKRLLQLNELEELRNRLMTMLESTRLRLRDNMIREF